MFDIAFSELLVIGVVALLVIGPEKLPKVARTAGVWMGRFQRYAAQIKEEVNRETRFAELQQLQQEIKQSVESSVASLENEVSALESRMNGDDAPKLSAKPAKPTQSRRPSAKSEEANAEGQKKSSKAKTDQAEKPNAKPSKAAAAKQVDAKTTKPRVPAKTKVGKPKAAKAATNQATKPKKALKPS